jgi:hypothetical protein
VLELKKISNQIFQVIGDTKIEISEAFCRIAEHYESPKFAGQVFTLGQFRAWYCSSEGRGAWTYYTDWGGFNVPDWAFDKFKQGLFDPLTEQEKQIVDWFRYKSGPFYVIGTSKEEEDSDILEHEICHALFYTNVFYRDEVIALLETAAADLKELEVFLLHLGYHKKVLLDECHAYICASSEYLDECGVPYPAVLKAMLQDIRKKYEIA